MLIINEEVSSDNKYNLKIVIGLHFKNSEPIHTKRKSKINITTEQNSNITSI